MRLFLTAIAILLLIVPSHADGPAVLPPGTLAVGKTGIYCITTPCPSRGIADAEHQAPADLLWSGDALPAMTATAQDMQRITAAWNALECLLVEGTFDGTTLIVDHIAGACP
jgi:hypothetical protein